MFQAHHHHHRAVAAAAATSRPVLTLPLAVVCLLFLFSHHNSLKKETSCHDVSERLSPPGERGGAVTVACNTVLIGVTLQGRVIQKPPPSFSPSLSLSLSPPDSLISCPELQISCVLKHVDVCVCVCVCVVEHVNMCVCSEVYRRVCYHRGVVVSGYVGA